MSNKSEKCPVCNSTETYKSASGFILCKKCNKTHEDNEKSVCLYGQKNCKHLNVLCHECIPIHYEEVIGE